MMAKKKDEPETVTLQIKREKGKADIVRVPGLGLVHLDANGEIVVTVDAQIEKEIRGAFKGTDYSVKKV